MKKLTAGIFATLLAVVSTGAANAEIASKGYVDDQVGTVSTQVGSLSTTVGQHTTQIAGKEHKLQVRQIKQLHWRDMVLQMAPQKRN